jgi:hypothetical protein
LPGMQSRQAAIPALKLWNRHRGIVRSIDAVRAQRNASRLTFVNAALAERLQFSSIGGTSDHRWSQALPSRGTERACLDRRPPANTTSHIHYEIEDR